MNNRKNKKNSSEINEIAKGLSMILQIGISMMVPVLLCLFIGYWLDKRLNTNYLMIIFIFLGIAAGVRSVYFITKSFYANDLKKETEDQKYFDELYAEHDKNVSANDEDKHM